MRPCVSMPKRLRKQEEDWRKDLWGVGGYVINYYYFNVTNKMPEFHFHCKDHLRSISIAKTRAFILEIFNSW